MASRKGYVSRAAIPPDVMARLNAGQEEPQTLAEWLAVDWRQLLATVLGELGLSAFQSPIDRNLSPTGISSGHHRDSLRTLQSQNKSGDATLGVMARQKALGSAFFELVAGHADGLRIYEVLASHRSGIVREWAALSWTANPQLSIAERLDGARRFAADPSMGVREIAWSSYRPYLAVALDEALSLLETWVRDSDPNIRRCAIESTRPRGVWCSHLNALKAEPQRALPLLDVVRADHARYVQLSVANWLNDASKHQPAWVEQTTGRWLAESPCEPTRWIVNHALRTLRKATNGADKSLAASKTAATADGSAR